VVVNYCGNAAAAAEAVEACRGRARFPDQRFAAVRADISDSADRERLVEEAWSFAGGLDALVNNAGVAPSVRADILEASEESFERLLRTNLQGPYFLTQAVARRMIAAGKPGPEETPKSIVFITSVSAETASVSRGEYCVSKAGLAMAAKLWAARLAGEGISVFEVRPGIMATDMTAGVKEKYDALIAQGLIPAARWGRPDDVGKAVRALLSGDFAYASGSVVHTDGGMHVPRL
jgi:NAD(P)-dependent dehydrogenase (short-subunit alcohol dehydrogenase family)